VIGLPVNDQMCLGSITEVIADMVKNQDPTLIAIAQGQATTAKLATWIRTLPQRDDDGIPGDGPKVDVCAPPQRLRIPADDPNCVERAALYVAVAELIDAGPTRQLATIDTANGLHTFPVENGGPVVLDPKLRRNSLRCGLALSTPGRIAVDSRDAIEWSAQLAADGAGTTNIRNGASRVARARNAMYALVDHGVVPAPSEVDAMGWMFALAENAARRFGRRALQMVRTVAHAISDVLDEVLAQRERNLSLTLDGTTYTAPSWLDPLVSTAARVGVQAGVTALAPGLGALAPTMLGAVEQQLNGSGLTLGPFAPPSAPPRNRRHGADRLRGP
jgi:hypothetical protein